MIIGLTGSLAAGKGVVSDFLKEREFKHYSVRNFLIEEIEKRGLPVNRDSMVSVANQLREINHPGYLAEQLYEKAKAEGGDCIIESLRTPGEILLLREKGNFILIAVDADPRIRYERAVVRKSETDRISFEEFMENEKREMDSDNPNKQNLRKCIEMADFLLENNGDLVELNERLEKIFEKIKSKNKRPSWDEYFMKMAALVAERSTCLRHHVGAVIVKDKRILTTGYNGAVRWATDCLELGCKKDELNLASGFGSEECRAVHAEQNAIIQAASHGISIDGTTLYCTTIPCRMCAKEIVNAGIKEIVTYSDYPGAKGSVEFLQQCGIVLRKIERPSSEISFLD